MQAPSLGGGAGGASGGRASQRRSAAARSGAASSTDASYGVPSYGGGGAAGAAGAGVGAAAPSLAFGGGGSGLGMAASAAGMVGASMAARSYFDGIRQRGWLSVDRFRYYFDVDTTYVANKLRLLMLPFSQRVWERQGSGRGSSSNSNSSAAGVGGADGGGPVPPRGDLLAPDLYIPVMAFITFIILDALAMGFREEFHPDVLSMNASSCLAATALEVIVLRVLVYMFGGQNDINVLDLVAFCAYKFVGMSAALVVGLVLGAFMYYVALLGLGSVFGFFLLRTLRANLLPRVMHNTAGGSRDNVALLVVTVVQPVMYWLLRCTYV